MTRETLDGRAKRMLAMYLKVIPHRPMKVVIRLQLENSARLCI